MELWVWSLILLVIGLGIVAVEIFIPSGGVLAVFAGLSFVGSLILAFMSGPAFVVGMMAAMAVLVPGILGLAIYIWPHTRVGQRMLVQPPTSDEEILPDVELRRHLASLVGRRGVARCKMLPSGIVAIDGRSYDAVSDGMPVDEGQAIEVIAVRMNRLEVRPLHEAELLAADPTPHDPLSRPIASLGLESLHDPQT